MLVEDTIVAIASGAGRGGVGIVRISGPEALTIAMQLSHKKQSFVPRQAALSRFYQQDGIEIDQGVVLWFPAPRSFTGEAVVELQGHGSPIALKMLVNRCCELGARPAQPGEFSLRAFLNDKLDLVQAEAIADLIDARSEQAAQSAVRSLSGTFSKKVQLLQSQLLNIRIYIEAALDFPDEDVDFLADEQLKHQFQTFQEQLQTTIRQAQQGQALRSGLTIAILGPPNAGKSSLLNYLSGEERAIVTEIPGTTRDVLTADLQIAGYPIHLLDTAGLRDTDDIVEQIGVRRAEQAAEQADHIFYLVDITQLTDTTPVLLPEFLKQTATSQNLTLLLNKIDQIDRQRLGGLLNCQHFNCIALSALNGEGVTQLEQIIIDRVGGRAVDTPFSARERHLSALIEAKRVSAIGYKQLLATGSGELVAEELKRTATALGEITGQMSSDDLLGHIFSSFCIGK